MSDVSDSEAQVVTYHLGEDGKVARVDAPPRPNEDAPAIIRVVDADGALIREMSSGDRTLREARRELEPRRLRSGGRFSPAVADQLQDFKDKDPEKYQLLVKNLGLPEDPHRDAFDFSVLDRLDKEFSEKPGQT
ncbi:MAG: hypothetical protein OXH51_11085 [Gemmatimonadetes bacterium]|nr:hypothetical protein [Gemmatimonadota bacterium]MCY3612067.1 hypothetical protein [Gemmatimonadota bacterium]